MTNRLFNNFFPPGVTALTSGRTVDFAVPPGRGDLTVEQKKFLSQRLGVPLKGPLNIRQVHGDQVLVVRPVDRAPGDGRPEADGLVTAEVGLPLMVRTADCLPVFMYDKKHQCIGLVHAGWRGCHQHIVQRALRLMGEEWQTQPEDVLVGLGPAIRSCCYEVGREFEGYFPRELAEREGRRYLDLSLVMRRQLAELGVRDEDVSDSGVCTCCDRNYFSYRRDGAAAGRMVSLLMLT
jgi:YfiH family protein